MKVVLVIDKPSDCSECPCCNARRDKDGDYYIAECQVKYDGWIDETTFATPLWCPLRPLPREWTMDEVDPCAYNEGFVDGVNYCIYSITGEMK